MKIRALILLVIITFTGLNVLAQPTITFEKTTQHLGFVRQGDTLNFQYKFTNTGNQPLLITDTKVECGCTVVDKPTDPILPGKQGVIKVTFHTNSAMDRQDRTVTVVSNASNSPAVVRFKCIVLKAKKA
ncbi:MAG TPA: DUF1573 domain-containing protein [Bacteroidia bacterium]|jgi:hypothetical protein|nr:DUF1573 domain-containing protein [Bacteroidia bacterium]